MVVDEAANARVATLAAFASGTMIAQQVAGRATRDALFLSSFPAAQVPVVMVAGAVMSFAAVIGLSSVLTRFSPARVVPWTFGVSAALLFLEWGLSFAAPAAAAVVLYLHLAILGATLISAFWSLVNERFDPHSARQSIGRIAGGGTVGGMLGGLFAWLAGRVISAPSMILALGAMSMVTAVLTRRLARGLARTAPVITLTSIPDTGETASRPTTASSSGLPALRDSRHLRDLALLVTLGAVSGALFDVALTTEAAAAITGREELLTFFALFHLAVSVLSFVLQATLANVALDRLGLAGTVGILPSAVIASALSIVVAPRLWVAAIVRGTDAVLRNSLFRSGYELLYTPVPPEQKRSLKTLIDVGFDRIGTAVGSGLAMLALALSPQASLLALIGVGTVAAAATLFFTPRLHRSYVAALEGSLRSGVVSLEPASIIDATTRRTLSGTIDALSRDKILAEIAALRQAAAARADVGPGDAPLPSGAAASGRALMEVPRSSQGTPEASGEAPDAMFSAIADLRSGDAERVRRALARDLDPALLPHVIPLLARDGLVTEAVRALRAAAPRATGQLLDALFDPAVSFAVRRRIPRVLQSCPTQRAADGLMLALADDRFEVRYQCGVALARLTQQKAPIALRNEDVIAAAQREIDVERQVWESRPPGAVGNVGPYSGPVTAERLLAERTSRSVEHIFRVLSLSLEREPLEIAYRALHGEDPHLRGTALEYLENVLPEPIRAGLLPFLGARPEPSVPSVKQSHGARDELLRSAASLARSPLPLRRRRGKTQTS